MRFSSIVTPASGMLSLPVAMMTCLAVCVLSGGVVAGGGGGGWGADGDAARPIEMAVALEPGDAVLLEEELDALDVGADDFGLAPLHPCEI